MKVVRVGKFGHGIGRAVWALRRVFLSIIGLSVLDLVVLGCSRERQMEEAAVDILAWLVGSGTVPDGVSFVELCCLLFAGFLGYSLLGLIVWVATVAALKAET